MDQQVIRVRAEKWGIEMDNLTRKAILESAGVKFAPGLGDSEFAAVQAKYGFTFPPDLRDFLAYALPVSDSWIDWRNDDEAAIRGMLALPYEGICFDIEHDDFWLDAWGKRPPSLTECFAIARKAVAAAPKLIPVYSHRYIPDRPCLPGNPVFSVHQTDIIYYGSDLQNYLENEFHCDFKTPKYVLPDLKLIRRIEFWTGLVEDERKYGWLSATRAAAESAAVHRDD